MNSSGIPNLPPQPTSITETGLSFGFLADLALKILRHRGSMLGRDVADGLRLPFLGVTDKLLDWMRQERLVEIRGAEGGVESTYQYVITHAGDQRALELMDRNQYLGPAPVTLAAYIAMVEAQSIKGHTITFDSLKSGLSHLVLNADIIERLGLAVTAGQSIFLFGNTGDGKTSIGLALGQLLPGAIWIPYAVMVEGQIIKVFDAGRHRPVAKKTSSESASVRRGLLNYLTREKNDGVEVIIGIGDDERYDERWTLIHRPLIVGGGEMTLKHLELLYDPTTKYYEAPQQMKANGGVFLLDDLGRQQTSPRALLNRWIVPLDKRVDYMTLATGYKFQIPFDVLVIFATNLTPIDIADESFLRRIRHKIHIPDPSWDEFCEIFKREAAKRAIPYSDSGMQYLFDEYYMKLKREPRGVHPRDLLDAIIEIARFQGCSPTLSNELIDLACQAYFIKNNRAEFA